MKIALHVIMEFVHQTISLAVQKSFEIILRVAIEKNWRSEEHDLRASARSKRKSAGSNIANSVLLVQRYALRMREDNLSLVERSS